MSYPKVYADFHNADVDGRLRLNCVGTTEDLSRLHIELRDGQPLTLYSEDLEVDGVVQYSDEERLWVALIDWDAVHQTEANCDAQAGLSKFQSKPTVMIVDDAITVRELLSMTLSKAGYQVVKASDGVEAWEKLHSGLHYDLVFLDVEMPRMDGLEMLNRLQHDPDLHDLPVAMLTSRGADRHKKMAIDLGAKAYFTKPYREEELLDGAKRMINGEVLV